MRGAQKKRMLSNIAFIGQLYMAGMLTSPILFNCCGKLLNQGQIDTPDADDTEALCKLLTLAGGRLEEDERKRKEPQPKVQFIFTLLSMLAKHPRLESRVRFLVQGIIDLRANKWELSGSAGTIERQARTVTLEEAKKLILEEEKADKEKLMRSDGGGSKGGHGYTGIGTSARQQVVRSFGGGGSGGGSASAAAAGGGGSQDFRSVAPTRKILGPTSTLGRKPAAPAGGASAEAASGSGGASTGESGWTMVLTKGTKGAAPSAPSGREPLASAVAAPARAAAESTEAAAPGAAGSLDIKAIVLSGEALAKRTTAIVQEYTRILDAEELVRSITEIRGSPGYGRVLVQGALLDSLLSSSMRQHGGAAFVALLACGLLQRSDVVAGVAAFMATYSDQVADAPKIGDYTALVRLWALHIFRFSPLTLTTSLLSGSRARPVIRSRVAGRAVALLHARGRGRGRQLCGPACCQHGLDNCRGPIGSAGPGRCGLCYRIGRAAPRAALRAWHDARAQAASGARQGWRGLPFLPAGRCPGCAC